MYRIKHYRIEPRSYPRRREEKMVELLDEFYWKCFFYLRMNRIEGDYLEFGSGSNVRSLRLAYKYKKLEYSNPRLFAFDSFKGLPEPTGRDVHPQWKRGSMAVTQKRTHEIMKTVGATKKDYRLVAGFYDETLDGHKPVEYDIQKAAMVLVDCDLYASARSALHFVRNVLGDGTILAFDDWFCFGGDPKRGEQHAFAEFRKKNKKLRFTEFQPFGWHGKSFLVHRAPSPRKRKSK